MISGRRPGTVPDAASSSSTYSTTPQASTAAEVGPTGARFCAVGGTLLAPVHRHGLGRTCRSPSLVCLLHIHKEAATGFPAAASLATVSVTASG